MTGFTPFPDNEQGYSARPVPSSYAGPAHTASQVRPPQSKTAGQPAYVRDAVFPAAVIALVCAGAAAYALLGKESAHLVREVLAAAIVGMILMVAVAFVAARSASRKVAVQVQSVRQVVQRGQAEVQQMVDRIMRGEQPAPLVPAVARVTDHDPFKVLAGELEQSQYYAGQAVLRVADKVFGGRSDQRVEIFVNLARRMQSLVHREIEMLDDLEAKVEDPDLLKGLFIVDHLATRLRRQSESLAVLGGSSSRRQWTRQVTMHEVLRAAVAEVEQYSRVKVVPPVEGVLRGSAVTDVIHLIAELVENATKFSAPHTTALLRAQHVSAGVAIEVEDRGLGMLPSDQQRMNDLLADPARMDVDELLRDGRIGLYVVATLARRHNIRVRVQNNIYGGTQAVVVLPKALLDQTDRGLPYGAVTEEQGQRLALVPSGAGTSSQSAEAVADVAPLPARSAAWGASGAPGQWPAESNTAHMNTAHMNTAHNSTAGANPAGLSPAELNPADGNAGRYGTDFGSPTGDAVPPNTVPPNTVPPNTVTSNAETRPPLPKRQVPNSFTPQANHRERGELGDTSAARTIEPPADQMTGLMADFLRGVSRAEEEDPSARD